MKNWLQIKHTLPGAGWRQVWCSTLVNSFINQIYTFFTIKLRKKFNMAIVWQQSMLFIRKQLRYYISLILYTAFYASLFTTTIETQYDYRNHTTIIGITKQSQKYVFFRKFDVFHGKNGCDCEDKTYSNCHGFRTLNWDAYNKGLQHEGREWT